MTVRSSCRLTCVFVLMFLSFPLIAATCDDLGRLSIQAGTITATELKSAGEFEQNFGPAIALPAHCRIAATLTPSSDSTIGMELWLPENWNGKFLALGNGGWAGSISFAAMAGGLQSGYAVASNDTGHVGGSAAFAIGHPEKVVDFAYRAMHEMVVHSKTLIQNYYERPAQLSYYQGCSTGGRQGMISAQRYPADFDAIIAGAPVYNQLALNATQFHNMKTLIENRSMALPPEKVEMLHSAVLNACEVNDQVEDGFLNNPLACDFEPASLQCDGADSNSCLTSDQVTAVNNVYGGVFAKNGEQLYPGHAKGFETGWRVPAEDAVPSALQVDATRFLVYEDADWDWREFDLERDLALARDKAGFIEALDPDLSEFKARGGKILFYHGWNDPGPSPINTINYYDSVLETIAGDNEDWMRLFMMPGMGHCRGGIGPDQADFLGALDSWREDGVAPDRITASRSRDGRIDMTRPLCAYPAVATWDGTDSPNEGDSYTCEE